MYMNHVKVQSVKGDSDWPEVEIAGSWGMLPFGDATPILYLSGPGARCSLGTWKRHVLLLLASGRSAGCTRKPWRRKAFVMCGLRRFAALPSSAAAAFAQRASGRVGRAIPDCHCPEGRQTQLLVLAVFSILIRPRSLCRGWLGKMFSVHCVPSAGLSCRPVRRQRTFSVILCRNELA